MDERMKNIQTENKLGILPIPKLLVEFGIPSVVSMLVNSIYNMVDQIYIGQKVGYLGNAATNVTFPFVIIGLAFSLMISVGSAANVGLSLGKGDQKKADRTLANGFALSLAVGVLLCIIGQLFLPSFLRLFGATDKVMPLAMQYARIYIIGIPFTSVGVMLSDEIRADGNPRYTMIAMLSGALFNIIFDYVFIFPMNMGVRGAALATILGQLLTMIVSLFYLPRMKTLHFRKENMIPMGEVIKGIFSLGTASFVTQSAMLIQQIVLNQQAVKYGALSEYGAEIPLTGIGIVMKVNALMTSIIMGMVVGSQPVYSFNYGARKYARVKQLTILSCVVGTVIGLVGTFFFQTFPAQIMAIFGTEDALYNQFAVLALKTMTVLIFILGVQMTAGTYFQSVGKPQRALIISLSRSLLFMIPSMLILPVFFGIRGVMLAFPVSDVCAVTLCGILLFLEIRNLNRMIREGA